VAATAGRHHLNIDIPQRGSRPGIALRPGSAIKLAMPRKSQIPDDHRAFAALPVRMVTVGPGDGPMAVHVAGRLTTDKLPVICVPGYHRNMSDYTQFVTFFQREMGGDWPVILLDLRGRGRSPGRTGSDEYGSLRDAADLSALADAFAIGSAVFVGQGYGGQVLMALAARRPTLIAGAVLIDAGPVTDSRGLVRLRNNLKHIEGLRSEAELRSVFRQMLSKDYPGTPEVQIEALAERSHAFDRRGRATPLFDMQLVTMLEDFSHDDVLVAQWPLFNALAISPLMLLRTQLTDQLRRETFEEMTRRRPDALALTIAGQGSPALLDHGDEIGAIAQFVQQVAGLGRP
jgi:pimeloyl-ACP methyl ester carboxylesterase